MSRVSNRQRERGLKVRLAQELWANRKPSYGDKVLEALGKMTDEEKKAVDALPYEERLLWFNNLVPPEENP